MRELDLKRVFTLFLMLILFIGFCDPVFSESSDKTDIIAELLAGRTTDWQGAASQLSELQLPLALAAVELLKFKAVHSEIPLDTDAVENFAGLVRQRIERSLMISFTQTDNCRQPVEAYEVVLAGQKLLVPTHYVADIKLTITACRPDGEAGTVFPEFCIDIFSQSPLAAHSLKIDGKTIPSSKIRLSVISDGYKLTWQPDLNADFMLAIGTHTAEINVTNEAGEQIERHWSFTVGVYDVPTDPLPVDALLLEELTVAANKLVPGADTGLTLTILIYQATDGRRFTEYRIKTASGQIITTRNPAQIARKLKVGRVSDPNITIYPLTSRAFAGNSLTFSYEWLGEGKVISEKWEISSGGHSTGEPTLTMRGDVFARCTLTIEHTGTDAAGNQIVFTTTVTSDKFIQEIAINTSIFPGRDLSLNNTGSATFSIANTVVNNVNFVSMVEGASYEFDNGGSKSILRVDKLSWVVHASDGNAKIADSSATSTYLYCKSPGLTELVVDVRLSWHQAGESYTSNFKPETSGLFAYYSANGRATFDKYPENLVYLTSRMIAMKEFEFTVNQQKRVVTAGNTELPEPVLLGRSSLWPASAPIMITAALPCMVHGRTGKWLSQDGDFRFITPVELDENIDLIPLKLGGRFSTTIYDRDTLFSTQLAPIAIVKPDDGLLELRINPSGPVITYEGATATFTAEVRPTVDFGSGSLSDATDDLDLFNGYRLSKVEHIQWFEVPLDASGDWKNKAPAGKGFTHFFTADSGPGSYTMNCAVSLEMKESDTGDTFIVGADNSVPVDVLPGLTIFSPIDELAYPLNATIKVKTSFDADEANWKNIVWRLNGKLFKPDTAGAPFFITANRFGKWSLEAVLTIKDPVTGTSTEMRDRITFAVKPCEISLSPGRKVFDMAVQNTQGLDLAVSLDGKTVERPGKAVPWQGNDIIAVVEPVAWSMVATPTACATIDTDEESFSAGLQFLSHGAATVLATVTVRIAGADDYFRRHAKDFEDEFEEPVFTFPAVRADLWAIKQEWMPFGGKFPTRAIQGTQRLFAIENGTVRINNKEYTCLKEGILEESLEIKPAISGVTPLKADKIGIDWFASESQVISGFSFKPRFLEGNKTEVTLKASIEFNISSDLKPEEQKYEVSVASLTSVIDLATLGKPQSVSINQPCMLSFFFGPEGGPLSYQNELVVWNGEYRISLDWVAWAVYTGEHSSEPIESTDPNVSYVRATPGICLVSSRPVFMVQPEETEVAPALIQLKSNDLSIAVGANILSWSIIPGLNDHLEGLASATIDPQTEASHYFNIYKTAGHWVWKNASGKVMTQPLAVGCGSSITLKADFGALKAADTPIRFEWFDKTGSSVMAGVAYYSDYVTIHTPEKIDRYELQLMVDGFDDLARLEVYCVQQISKINVNNIYYLENLKKSVAALRGYDKHTVAKLLVDMFYLWWWSSENRDIQYGIPGFPGDASAASVCLKKGGMCQALGNFFYKCLECHGIEGLTRAAILLNDNRTASPAPPRSLAPTTTEYWGAIVCDDPGLNQTEPQDFWPTHDYISAYGRSHSYRYIGTKMIPDVATATVVIERATDIVKYPKEEYYMFLAPGDGHALVYFESQHDKKQYLYDPSFGKGKFFSIEAELASGTFQAKNFLITPETKFWKNYVLKTGWHLRGFTLYKDSINPHGLGMFDVPVDRVNFFEVNMGRYQGSAKGDF